MNKSMKSAALAAVLLAAFSTSALANVIVYAGYLNNLSAVFPADVPTPFDPSATTTLISSGGSTTSHDTGVIRFHNDGTSACIIDLGVKVTVQSATFQLWDSSLPFSLAGGSDLVLAETANFNFDSSDFGLGSNPIVTGSVNGVSFSFVDTGGILLGKKEAGNGAETTPYGVIGVISKAIPNPGTLPLMLSALLGIPLLRRNRN